MRFLSLKKIRSLFIGCFVTISLCLPFLIVFLDKALAQSQEEWTAKLVEGAKKEGNVRWSCGMSIPESDKLLRRFNEKYPFIKTSLNRSTGQAMVSKTLIEARAGIHNFDVFQTSFTVFTVLKENKLLTKYISPESKYFPKVLVDPEGYWTDHYSSHFVMGYNTKLVPPKEAPKTWTDLLDPKWKGKMGMDDKAFEWFAGVLRIMGEENGMKYFEKLSNQDILFRTGKTLLSQLIVAGEVNIGITQYIDRIEELKSLGAPVEWIAVEPVVTILHPISISAYARNPNSAKLLVDFLLSKEGQEILIDFYRIPSRIGVKSRGAHLKEGTKLLPYDSSFVDDYNRIVRLFREILLRPGR